MTKFSIIKFLKTKNKTIFEAETAEEIKAECERLNLREFSKPYILTHIRAEDINGKAYGLTQRFFLANGQSLPVSPDDLIKVFNL
jgi:hypothetical protein